MANRPLWTCEACGRAFANRNQRHACGRLDLARHFAGREPVVREIHEAFVAAIRKFGPVKVLPEKTRIAFQVRMSFAQLTPRKAHATGHLVLARRAEGGPFTKVETISARNHVHHFRLDDPSQVDARLRRFLEEAYAVGRQEHLRAPAKAPASVDEYIAAASPDARPILERIRATLLAAAPGAEELVSYRMPAIRQGRILAYYAAFKDHIGFYPPVRGDAALVKAASRYAGEKGNLRLPIAGPIPYALLARIVKARARGALKSRTPPEAS